MKNKKNGLFGGKNFFPAVAAVSISGIMVLVLAVSYPFAGNDCDYFYPRLVDTMLFYLKNGPAVQWWTPSFGGGLPSFPNPQQMQFSIPQMFVMLIDPWKAVALTVFLFTGAGFCGAYLFFRRVFGGTPGWATLGATLFSSALFTIHHVNAGHLGFHAFPLLSFIPLLITMPKGGMFIRTVSLAAIFSYLIYGAGFYLIPLFIVSTVLVVAMVRALVPAEKILSPHKSLVVFTAGLLIAAFTGLAKVVAVGSFMRYFPRTIHDVRGVSYFRGFLGFAADLFFTPFAVMLKKNPLPAMKAFSGLDAYIWEFDIGISPAVLIFLIGVILISPRNEILLFLTRLFKTSYSRACSIIFILLAGITIELIIGIGPLYRFIRTMPVFGSLHMFTRFGSAFIFPITLATIAVCRQGAEAIKKPARFRNLASLNLFSAMVILLLLVYSPGVVLLGTNSFNADTYKKQWRNVKNTFLGYTVQRISNSSDAEVFNNRSSSLQPYEPVFGYNRDEFHPLLRPARVDTIVNGAFNITNPASLVYPEENGIAVFSPISADEKEAFEAFVRYHPCPWKLSPLQIVANMISFVTIVSMLIGCIVMVIRKKERHREG
ncbi:MAG: hypothetical protein JXA18_16850 [Chitinispirillaceae bacterium]|nr:hypothetical protein [Chitinispirillaceae bacterium]